MTDLKYLKRFVLTLAGFAVLAIASSTAKADIVVVTGVNNQGTDNVLLNPATNVLTVTGTVGQNNLLVNFTSSSGSGLLNANPSGQATVSGGTGNTALTQLTFGLANNDTFTRAVFNINASTSGSVLIHVEGVNINGGFFEDDFTVDANGQNFFTLNAINGEVITDIQITELALDSNGFFGWNDFKQPRVSGLCTLQGATCTAIEVPEPSSLALFGAGLVAAWWFATRRKASSLT